MFQVYDGPNTNWPEMVKHCGTTLPSPVKYRSTSNTMYVKMRTDQSQTGRGFSADFETSKILYKLSSRLALLTLQNKSNLEVCVPI